MFKKFSIVLGLFFFSVLIINSAQAEEYFKIKAQLEYSTEIGFETEEVEAQGWVYDQEKEQWTYSNESILKSSLPFELKFGDLEIKIRETSQHYILADAYFYDSDNMSRGQSIVHKGVLNRLKSSAHDNSTWSYYTTIDIEYLDQQ